MLSFCAKLCPHLRTRVAGSSPRAASALPGALQAERATDATFAPARNTFAYRFTIGDIEAWSISDCNLALNAGLTLMWPEGERGAMKADMIAHGERTDVLPLYVSNHIGGFVTSNKLIFPNAAVHCLKAEIGKVSAGVGASRRNAVVLTGTPKARPKDLHVP